MAEPHWVISESALAELLGRAHAGEEPGALLVEFYANSDTEEVPGD